MNPNSLITVIVPTFQRRNWLERSLTYWKCSGFKVLVADGSFSSNSDLVPKEFQYLWKPELSIIDRWLCAIQSVKTKYMVLCADDDFIGIDAINSCVHFLDTSSDYSCAQGRYAFFNKKTNGYFFGRMYDGIEDYPLSDPVLQSRVFNCFRHYFHTIYSVQRVENVLKFLDNFPKLTNANVFEMQFTVGNSVFGKHRIFPFLYGVREIIAGSGGQTTQCVTKWIESDPESFEIWRNFVIDRINSITLMGFDSAEACFDNAILGYGEFVKELDGKVSLRQDSWRGVKELIKGFIPKKMIRKIQEKRLEKSIGVEPDLVKLTRKLYSPESFSDAMRIQESIMGGLLN